MSINLPPVCILTAGKGTRMGPFANIINKALLPLAHKAMISHIIEGFPTGTEFIVALGHQSQQVRDYLAMAHPDVSFVYVEVDLLEGPGSGPGYSLGCCKKHCQRPFYFVACDTLFTSHQLDTHDDNWIGVAAVDPNVSDQYCNIALDGDRVVGIRDKQKSDSSYRAFVGHMFIRDYENFWQALESNVSIQSELQISNGLKGLINGQGLKACLGQWTDVGTFEKFRQAVEERTDYDFSKTNEFLYFVNHRVIKFFADAKIIKGRVEKVGFRPSVFPEIHSVAEQFYGYDLIPGETLYARNNPELFKSFLAWLSKELWKPVAVDPEKMKKMCRSFYHTKTMERLAAFEKKYPGYVYPKTVNGEKILPVREIFERLDWDSLFVGAPVFIHGDLQFDNVIYDKSKERFVLLDWRQDFSGEVAVGDLYYDLSKMMGGIILNYDYIKANLFQVEENGTDMIVDFARRYNCLNYEKIFEDFIIAQKLDLSKVRLLIGLIYLNMSPLHHPPFDRALYGLGSLFLTRMLR
ncbi:MAG: hypothetical protein HW380_1403 [Magnetococcales bacterium]|nr:hypothetical protein [Magnetococcales bacterium]HIJ85746.1 NTP transferase domain-containing protein [Magnetococcales bacterium]